MKPNPMRCPGRALASWFLVTLMVACGGGNAAGTATPPADATLTVSTSTGGSLASDPVGVSCEQSCSASYPAGTSMTLRAHPAAGYEFERWSGVCSGSTPSCTFTLGEDAHATASFVPTIPMRGAPFVYYTDALTGPITGGENNAGGYLSIFGTNFGAAGGLGTTTKVYIGGVEVANYRYLGPAKVGSKLGLQQLAVQVGNLGNPALGVALPIKVVVHGVASNTTSTFTPCAGRVLFVSLNGNDSTAVAGDITKPWRYLQNADAHTGAYFASKAGDQIVIRGGNWSDTNGVDTTWMRASMSSSARNGTPTAWLHITAYPGPIKGNAIEDVHYTTPAGMAGGIWGPWSAIAGTSGEYWSVSNLRMEVSGQANSDAAPINLQYTAGHWRVVNNELGPWPVSGVQYARAGGIAGYGDDVKILGNHIHHIGGTSDLENHGIYAETSAMNWEVGYNWIHDITGGSLVQFSDMAGAAGSLTLPHGGTWPGYVGIRVHHNWLENSAKYGLNINDTGSTSTAKTELRAWNNVIAGTKMPPVRMNSTTTSKDITIAYNTLYNAMVTNSGSGNAYFRNEDLGLGAIRIYNNLLAIGASTTSGTTWFADTFGQSSGWSFQSNLYWDAGRGVAPVSTDATRVAGDPKFVNATGGNLTLASGSPAVDKAAQALPFTVTDDLTTMDSRPKGAANDIGAFERVQ